MKNHIETQKYFHDSIYKRIQKTLIINYKLLNSVINYVTEGSVIGEYIIQELILIFLHDRINKIILLQNEFDKLYFEAQNTIVMLF